VTADNKASPFDLTERDLQLLAARYIDPETARLNNIYRVDDVEGAEIIGRRFGNGERYSGLVIPNYRVEFLTHVRIGCAVTIQLMSRVQMDIQALRKRVSIYGQPVVARSFITPLVISANI
jgi:hypothetical protein